VSGSDTTTASASLRAESHANLLVDRNLQSKFKGDKAGGPLLGSSKPLGTIGRRSGILLSTTSELAVALMERTVRVPDTFASLHDYRNVFVSALEEEVSLRMRDVALVLYRAMQEVSGLSASITNCNCGMAAAVKVSNKDNANKGRAFFTCNSRKCSFFKWVDAVKASHCSQGSDGRDVPQAHGNISIDTRAPAPDLRLVRQRSHLAVFKCVLLAKQPFMNKSQRTKFSQQEGPRQLDNSTSFLIRVSDEDAKGLCGAAKNDLWVRSCCKWQIYCILICDDSVRLTR
jgi:hypothetical protein